MKLFFKRKDGGPASTVTGFFLIEWKKLFTVALLRFDSGSRDAYHSHAFNSVSWVLSGGLVELHLDEGVQSHTPSLKPVITRKTTFHKVFGIGKATWVLTFRGPWAEVWNEYLPEQKRTVTLTKGRHEINR